MKIALVVYSTDPETVWNAFRLGVFALLQKDSVTAFLLAGGVECESLHTEKFPVKTQMQAFANAGGNILASGTCLKLRQSNGSELCQLSTMQDLYELIRDSGRVLSF